MSLVLKLCLSKNLSRILERNVTKNGFIAIYKGTIVSVRHQSQKRDLLPREERHKTFAELTTAEKIKAGTNISFAAICVIAGIAGTIGIIVFLWNELFVAGSPTSVYSMASSVVLYNEDVIALLGDHLSVYGKDTYYRRARQTPYFEERFEGRDRIMAVRFRVNGSRASGSVFATAKFDNQKKKYILQTVKVMPDFDKNKYLSVFENLQ